MYGTRLPFFLLVIGMVCLWLISAGPVATNTLSTNGLSPADYAWDIAVDSQGYSYIVGLTGAGDFPVTAGAWQTEIGSLHTADAFIAKLSPDGQTLIYSTYLGGSGDEEAVSVAVDSAGQAYVTGFTNSLDFPIINAAQAKRAGGRDAFVTKLSADGSTLLYSTYWGGSSNDWSRGIAVDVAGNAYIVGNTSSIDFPTINPLQSTNSGDEDLFVVGLSADGNSILYSTYLGGGQTEYGFGIAASAAGEAHVTGYTRSADFPTINAWQPTLAGTSDAFVAGLTQFGNALEYSTYLGGGGFDSGIDITLDSAENVYVTGGTAGGFPIVNGLPGVLSHITSNVFVAKLPADGSTILYSTSLGGSNNDFADAIAVDSQGLAYVTGTTLSLNFPTVNPLQSSHSPGDAYDAYALVLNTNNNTVVYSTYLGGYEADEGKGIAIDAVGSIYLTGYTHSSDFPTINPFQSDVAGNADAFTSKLASDGGTFHYSTYLGGGNAYPAPTNVNLTRLEQKMPSDGWLLFLLGGVTIMAIIIWLIQICQRIANVYFWAKANHG